MWKYYKFTYKYAIIVDRIGYYTIYSRVSLERTVSEFLKPIDSDIYNDVLKDNKPLLLYHIFYNAIQLNYELDEIFISRYKDWIQNEDINHYSREQLVNLKHIVNKYELYIGGT